jgi:hypothetical protein
MRLFLNRKRTDALGGRAISCAIRQSGWAVAGLVVLPFASPAPTMLAATNAAEQCPSSAGISSAGISSADISSAGISWAPSVPAAGTLFEVRSVGSAAIQATVAGEPLHFATRPGHADTLFAVAAAPVDSTAGVTLEFSCGTEALLTRRIPTAAGDYPMEQLKVAPNFSAPASAALTERMRNESAKAAAVSKGSHETPALWEAPFHAPRTTRITSAFGGGRTFNGTVTSRHMGTDYAGAVGAPVKAVNRGVVRIVDRFYLGGNVIYVDHGAGLVTAYLHLSKQLVAVGDTVRRGDVIGHVGATGRVTGPHLHIIARYGQITVDATTLLQLR